MSAITGIYYRDGRLVNKRDIIEMNKSLSHRGPDDSGVLYNGKIAFGHQMLHTTPESINEKLPYDDEISGLIITSDARIDNRKELSEILNLQDSRNVADSIFILKAYQKWGDKCPEKLLGDFAFAIWDSKKECIFCARDHMGVKPFYYYLSEDMFLFSTEINAILDFPVLPYSLNEYKLGLFLKNDSNDAKLTIYNEINSLPAANSICITQKNVETIKYWKLDPKLEITLESEEEYKKEYIKILEEAINCRLRCEFKLGFELSGGLDSSSIVCLTKKKYKENNNPMKIKTFSYIFNELKECDESYFIRKITDSDDIEPHFVIGDDISPFENIEYILKNNGRPIRNPFLPLILNLYKKMEEKNIRVFLSGAGGDSVISKGDGYFLELFINLKWNLLYKNLKASARRTKISPFREFINQIIFPLFPENMKKIILNQILNYSHGYRNTLNKEFATKIKENSKKDLNIQPKISKKLSKEMHYYQLNTNTHQQLFEVIDVSTARFRLEPRYPYYDKRLIEYCYAIPSEMKFKIWNRYIQRASMENIIPSEIQWRESKTNFKKFLNDNLILMEEYRLESIFNNETIVNKYIDIRKLKIIYEDYNNNRKLSYQQLYYLWLTMILFFWLKDQKLV